MSRIDEVTKLALELQKSKTQTMKSIQSDYNAVCAQYGECENRLKNAQDTLKKIECVLSDLDLCRENVDVFQSDIEAAAQKLAAMKIKKRAIVPTSLASKKPILDPKSPPKAVPEDARRVPPDSRPTWSFLHADFDYELSPALLFNSNHWEKLISFESMTWREISETPGCHHWGGIENWQSVHKTRFEERSLLGVGNIFQLRLTGAGRLYGVVIPNGVFCIVWYDAKHQVYLTPKKNT